MSPWLLLRYVLDGIAAFLRLLTAVDINGLQGMVAAQVGLFFFEGESSAPAILSAEDLSSCTAHAAKAKRLGALNSYASSLRSIGEVSQADMHMNPHCFSF